MKGKKIRAPLAAMLAVVGALSAYAASLPQEDKPSPPEPGKEVVTRSGLKYVDLKVGAGDAAHPAQVVDVHYTGWLTDGTKFESSRDANQPLTFRVGAGDVLKGWDEGVIGMKVGGKRRLVLPPELGYGKQGAGSVVPPNATLVFEFELLAVRKPSQERER
jgi:FKBP-type peptidyl-prolyl cis-trans isomerase FkpA